MQQQRRLAHRHGEVGVGAVVRPDERGRADVPAHRGVVRHQPAGPGQHQGRAAAPDRAHLVLRQAAQGVQRVDVELLVPPGRASGAAPPAPQPNRSAASPTSAGRDVVAGGQPQPAARRARAARPAWAAARPGRSGGSSSRGITVRASRDRSPGCPCAHSSIRSALIRLSQVSAPGALAGRVSQRSTRPARLVFQPLTPTLSSPAATASSIAARAGVVGGPLVRAHDRGPGQQVGVRRHGVRAGQRPGVGGEALGPRAGVGADDLRGLLAGADLRVALHPGQGEQPGEGPGDREVRLGRAAACPRAARTRGTPAAAAGRSRRARHPRSASGVRSSRRRRRRDPRAPGS